ncbi:MAG: hypothetical protein ATN35_09685 [Epulopiscium sp. Nele67-Bin004]|nr:MAG: hypothetical protein ATN35_09685 [Epulopiscium sp. Nele67-Bin004]
MDTVVLAHPDFNKPFILSVDAIENESLEDIFCTVIAITKTINKYHEAGYLYLDIKPANILKIPETPDIIMLFDFGTVVKKEFVQQGELFSFSENWAPPEIKKASFAKICEASDLYFIGNVLLSRIRGSSIQSWDYVRFPNIDFNSPILDTAPPVLIRYLKEIFAKTLCNIPRKRYQTATELEQILNKALPFTKLDCQYIKSNFVYTNTNFIGRTELLVQIKQIFEAQNALFLRGFGGIGKSSVAKKYASIADYNSVTMLSYTTSIFDCILNDDEFIIENFERDESESDGDYYKRKLTQINKLADDNTLIILDNFDVEEDEHLIDLLDCGAKVLVTTRCDYSDYDFMQIDVMEFETIDEAEKLFYANKQT